MGWLRAGALAGGSLLLLAVPAAAGYPWEWSLVVLGASLGLGAVSLLAYARRLLFAAASAPHAAFFAAALAMAVAGPAGALTIGLTVLVGLLLVYLIGGLAYLGLDPDESTAVVASLSSSGGAIAAYYALTRREAGAGIASIIIGDPLLATRAEAVLALIIGLVAGLFAFLGAREVVYIGLDRDDAVLSGARVWLYDLVLYSLLGVTVMSLVRTVGFVIEHVLLLVPGAVAAWRARSPPEAVAFSVALTLLAGAGGLAAGILLDMSPSGLIGLILVAVYALGALERR